MLSLKRTLLAAIAVATLAAAQPALTTIQDTLYRADGTRFTGTMFITWSSFQAGDTSNIATSNLTLPIVNGVLKVNLVPTTTASPGAQYNITYNSQGINQFTEVWAVPPSTVPLRVRDVRVSQGSVVGPSSVTSPIQISDVTGLLNELTVRPMKGVGFSIGRTAVINQAGQIDGAAGNVTDCVRVDGSSGPCGSGGGAVPNFQDEVPQGLINGANTVFTLSFAPSPASSLQLVRNGLRLVSGVDYLLSANTVTFFIAAVPQTGDQLMASYRYANPNDPNSTLTAAEVVCSSAGGATSSPTDLTLGTCTIPQGLLTAGDRLDIRMSFSHSGTSVGFSTSAKFGSTTVMARTGAATETAVVGSVNLGLASSSQIWSTQTWSSVPAEAFTVGTSHEDVTQPLTIAFHGNLAGAASDVISLVNFTVIRYPAQSNP